MQPRFLLGRDKDWSAPARISTPKPETPPARKPAQAPGEGTTRLPLRRSLQEQRPGSVLQPPAPGYLQSHPTYSIRPPTLRRGSSRTPQTPHSDLGPGGPVRTRSPPGSAAAAASAQAHTAAVTLPKLFFFFPFQFAFLNNLALFEHTRVNNGHRGKRLFSKRIEDNQKAGWHAQDSPLPWTAL